MAIEHLPKDPVILLSFVNTHLRDEEADLDDFCARFEIGRADLEARLLDIGYTYNASLGRFQ